MSDEDAEAVGRVVGFLLMVALTGAALWGWVLNCIKLAHMSFEPWTGMAILRILGILVWPLGAVLGYVG